MSDVPPTRPAPPPPAWQPPQPDSVPPAPPAEAQIDLQIAVIEATARIVSGAQSSHLIQDPDIAQGVAASFRTIYDAIMGAVSGAPAPNGETRAGITAGS
jgi:hypothetical protein